MTDLAQVNELPRAQLEALLRLAHDALDWEAATACRIMLSDAKGSVRVSAARRV
jgi:hypothetical protein